MDAAHKETEKELSALEKKLNGIYSRTAAEVAVTWKDYMMKIGKEVEALQKQYDEAKDSGDKPAVRKLGIKLNRLKRERTIHDERYKALVGKTLILPAIAVTLAALIGLRGPSLGVVLICFGSPTVFA